MTDNVIIGYVRQTRLQGTITQTRITARLSFVVQQIEGEYYQGAYEVTPRPFASTVLQTQNKVMTDNVTVLEIPYYETSNIHGKTVIIGGN